MDMNLKNKLLQEEMFQATETLREKIRTALERMHKSRKRVAHENDGNSK